MHVPFPVEHASNEGRRRESSNDFVLEEACRDRCAQANSSREPAALRNTSDGSRVLVRDDKKIRRVATPASGHQWRRILDTSIAELLRGQRARKPVGKIPGWRSQ